MYSNILSKQHLNGIFQRLVWFQIENCIGSHLLISPQLEFRFNDKTVVRKTMSHHDKTFKNAIKLQNIMVCTLGLTKNINLVIKMI